MKNIVFIFVVICSIQISFTTMAQDKQIRKAVEGNNEFCFDLMEASYEEGKNQALSPFSISIAMAMTYDGTAWRTKWDMAKTMHFPFSREKNHEAWTQMLNHFKQLKTPLFKLANAVWAQENYHFEEDFLSGLKDFDAKVEHVNFKSTVEREKGRRKINQWVESKTERKIRQLIRKDNIDELTRMVLVNAIYFNADWQQQFDPEKTRKNDFKTPDGKIKTNFMSMKSELLFSERDNFDAVQLPYKDERASMYIILPDKDKNPGDILKTLDSESFGQLCQSFKETKLMLALPKFKAKARYEMKDILMDMGMVAPFSHYANLSGINGKLDLLIDDVIHQAMVEVDEEGTEATASTAVVISRKSTKRPKEFIVDRPFIFLIKEHKQGNILFAGIVNNPENTEK